MMSVLMESASQTKREYDAETKSNQKSLSTDTSVSPLQSYLPNSSLKRTPATKLFNKDWQEEEENLMLSSPELDNSACLQELSDLECCQESELFDWELFVADLLTFEEEENSLEESLDSFNETNYAHLHREPLLSSTKLGEDGNILHPPSAAQASAHNNSKEKTMIFDNNLLSHADDLTWFLNRRMLEIEYSLIRQLQSDVEQLRNLLLLKIASNYP